jgi:hypothetical protein
MSQKSSFFVLPTGAAASASGDAVFKGGYLKIGGTTSAWLASMPAAIRNTYITAAGIKNGFYRAYAAEVARVITITPTAANSTDYRVTLSIEKGQQFDNNLPNEVQTVFTHTTPLSGGTATTISAAFIAAINSHPYWSLRVTASGSATVILTGKAGFPIFSAAGGANTATVVTTPGSVQMGLTGAQLIATGFAFNADTGIPVAATNYDICTLEVSGPTETVLSAGADHRISFAIIAGGNNANFIAALAALISK